MARVGLPVVFKPDTSAGAVGAFKVASEAQLQEALAHRREGYVVQQFSPGTITTYDGLTDGRGEVVFDSSLVYGTGIMESLSEAREVAYWTRRAIPPALAELGRRTVAAFGLRERFFHIEFFELADGTFRALEVNLRPPGGFTTDMMNWSCDGDVYRLWAAVVCGEQTAGTGLERRYHCAHLGRRKGRPYRASHDDLLRALGPGLLAYRELPPPIAEAMGDSVYLVRFADLERLMEARDLVLARAR
ncbi:MAG: hypothetical protein QM765_44415 [Myxococcales bacterium]